MRRMTGEHFAVSHVTIVTSSRTNYTSLDAMSNAALDAKDNSFPVTATQQNRSARIDCRYRLR